MLVPVATAALALAVALAGYVMVKFYGVVFLGLPREELTRAHDAGRWERVGLVWLAAWCVVLGLLPVVVISALDPIARALVGASLAQSPQDSSWLFLTAIAPERASYSPLLFLLGILLAVAVTFLLGRRV
jgi:formate hydrogenlyase subunit 3/multisubunit Na+/H+ antiporter MnhD subunit